MNLAMKKGRRAGLEAKKGTEKSYCHMGVWTSYYSQMETANRQLEGRPELREETGAKDTDLDTLATPIVTD